MNQRLARPTPWSQVPQTAGPRHRRVRSAEVAAGATASVRALLVRRPLRQSGWQELARTRPTLDRPTLVDRSLVPRGPRPIRTAAFLVVALIGAIAVAPRVTSLITGPPEASNPFLLDQGGATPGASPDPPDYSTLEHPVDPNLKANPPDPTTTPAALAGAGWFGEFSQAQGWSYALDTVWRPVNIYPELDFTSAYLSVIDGRRTTWEPPRCSCPTIEVWMYGGSTMFGLNQRDDHTIASEFARVAHRNGLNLVVRNHGVLGYLHWLEAERFSHDLLTNDAPDMVVFYDGVNDGWASNMLNDRESGDVMAPIDPTNTDVWGYSSRSDPPMPAGPTGSKFIGRDRGIVLELEQLARTTIDRYDRSRRYSQAIGDAHDVEVRYAWQPSRVSRDIVLTEPHGDAASERYVRLRDQLQADFLPDDVIDLVDVFDDTTDPLFTDDVHHNEEGSRIVARELYAALEDDLRSLLRARSN